jgi:hypothetical protein
MEQRRMSTRRGSLAEVRRGRVQVSARARQIALRAGTLAVAALALFLAACVTIRIDEPSGFAVSSNAGGRFKAVSPEGVLFAVRTEENYPEMDAAFWREAVKTQLVTEGYVILTGPESIEASGREGFLVEWGVPFRNDTYVYLTAVIPRVRPSTSARPEVRGSCTRSTATRFTRASGVSR